jgi:hypothetical protein
VPGAHGVGGRGVAHEDGVHRVAEELLHEHRRPLVGADEVGERAEHGALAELLALLQQARGRRRQADAVALELLERVHLAL